MKRIDQLTFTRFVAALAVVLFHTGSFPFNQFPWRQLFASGQIAVTYFFVLSGFVLTLAYFQPGREFHWRDYLRSRFSRIYPVYLLSFLVTCLYYLDIMAKVDSKKILANLFLLQAWVPSYTVSFNYVSWSLSVEAFLYVVFPFLIPFLGRVPLRSLIIGSAVFWGLSTLLLSALYVQMMPDGFAFLHYFPLFHLGSFVMGVVAGVWYLHSKHEVISPRTNMGLLVACLLVLGLSLMYGRTVPILNTIEINLLAPLFTLLIVALALDSSRLSQILGHPALVTLGEASYALYIINIPVRWFGERLLGNSTSPLWMAVFPYAFIILVILLSILIYRKFEIPARDWIRGNSGILLLFVLDLAAMLAGISAAFLLWLGPLDLYEHNWRTFTYTIRLGPPIFMSLWLALGLYERGPHRFWSGSFVVRLLACSLAGGLILSGFVYWAWADGLVNGFPRPILALCALFAFGAGWLTRILFHQYARISLQSAA
jgi:peptidoglycan/LPS O-acetylase OafA/YrhL